MSDDKRPTDLAETSPLSAGDLRKLRAVRLAVTEEQQATLLIYFRDGVRVVHLGEGESVVVGRARPADVPIRDNSLSRQHACVELTGGEIWIEDLQSTNGTLVGGEKIERCKVEPGAEITFGAVPASVHARGRAEGAERGAGSHEGFQRALELEVRRAHDHRRVLALLLLRADRRSHPARWIETIRGQLRPYDRLALYSNDTVEVLLPETGAERARQLGLNLLGVAPTLRCGVSVFPDHGASGDELLETARTALRAARGGSPLTVAEDKAVGRWTPVQDPTDRGPVVASAEMRRVYGTLERLATSVVPVLIHGETGTGKEVVARAIHQGGTRAAQPMIAVNCAALPSQLIESTLFGHEKGAFTGADRRTEGVFEAADGGTVFLDEIGELPPQAQAALLRVLENQRFSRVGSNDEVEVDVRVLAATHRDLQAMCEEGEFREDLYYRLNVMILDIPPLRERRDDIEPLARRFLGQASRANERQVGAIDDDAMAALLAHTWPGNVRELRNVIERAVVIALEDVVTVDDLPGPIRDDEAARSSAPAAPRNGPAPTSAPEGEVNLKAELQRLESEMILSALKANGWDRKSAAAALGLPLSTMAHKMKSHGIRRVAYQQDADE